MNRLPFGHLGTRVSALLDGQLNPVDEERAWAHVHACHPCRDLVEWEGAVKRRLASLAGGSNSGPDRDLQASLLSAPELWGREVNPAEAPYGGTRLRPAVAIGGVALSAAMASALLWAGLSPLLDHDVEPPATSLTPSVREPVQQVTSIPSSGLDSGGFEQDKWGQLDPSGTMRR